MVQKKFQTKRFDNNIISCNYKAYERGPNLTTICTIICILSHLNAYD